MLDDYIQTNGLNATILHFEEEVAHCAQARVLEKTHPIVKTIVLAHDKGYALAIVEGTKHVDLEAIKALLETHKVRLATPEEVEQVTGYSVGGVPPISIYGTPTLIDEGVLTHAWVVAGGGDKNSLLKIQTRDILEHAYEPTVVHVAK